MGDKGLVLKVGGKAYSGWQEITVEKSMDQISGSFTVKATDKYPLKPHDWEIHLGDPCTVEINDHLVITGFVEAMPISYSKDEHSIEINGRDVTGDLVDCSFVSGKSEFIDTTMQGIVTALCKPFGIPVVVESQAAAGAAKKISVNVEPGDAVFEIISKCSRIAQVLPVSYGDGKLYLTLAGSALSNGGLELGKNVLRATSNHNDKDRFSEYWVKGSGKATDDSTETKDVVSPKGHAIDSIISRHRPLVILADKDVDHKTAKTRAEWEAHMRAGASREYEYAVQGWLQPDGTPWEINRLVRVKDAFFGLDETLLLSSLSFSIGENGTITTMIISDPEKYLVPLPEEDDTASDISGVNDILKIIREALGKK